MENLLKFLKQYRALFLFVFLETMAVFMMVYGSNFHKSKIMSSVSAVTGGVYSVSDVVSGYFHLRTANELLSQENTLLKNQNQLLKEQLALQDDGGDWTALKDTVVINDSVSIVKTDTNYVYINARVIHNSVNKQQNYMVLNKGSKDGIKPDMGVVCSEGVVGVVEKVSKHYATVIPLVNVKLNVSAKLDSCQNFGSLQWDGLNCRYAVLNEIPEYAAVKIGEKVVSSGYSFIFPEGIAIGTVEEIGQKDRNDFLSLKIRLAVDFQKIAHVQVIDIKNKDELILLGIE